MMSVTIDPKDVVIYDVAERVLDYYNQQMGIKKRNRIAEGKSTHHRYSELTLNVARKKFSCMIANCDMRKHDAVSNVTKYKYCNYTFVVDENTKTIFMLYMDNDKRRDKVSNKKRVQETHRLYQALGLDKRGRKYSTMEY